jgi:hypothetical protein
MSSHSVLDSMVMSESTDLNSVSKRGWQVEAEYIQG